MLKTVTGVYSASRPINLVPAAYVMAPIPIASADIQETARRVLGQRYNSEYTLVARLPHRDLEASFEYYESSALSSFYNASPAWYLNCLTSANRFITQRQDATGLEFLYTSALQSLWERCGRLCATSLSIWQNFVRDGRYAETKGGFVFDASVRTLTTLQPGEMAKFKIDGAILDLIGSWQNAVETPAYAGESDLDLEGVWRDSSSSGAGSTGASGIPGDSGAETSAEFPVCPVIQEAVLVPAVFLLQAEAREQAVGRVLQSIPLVVDPAAHRALPAETVEDRVEYRIFPAVAPVGDSISGGSRNTPSG